MMMEHFYLLPFVSFIFILVFVPFYRHRSKFMGPNLPPGKIGYPVIGESFEFLSAGWKGQPGKFIFDRMAKNSSQVFKTSLFGEQAAIFCGAACNKFLFSNEDKLVTAWWPNSINKIFPSSSQTTSMQEAKKMRKLLIKVLKPDTLQHYIGVMDSIAQRHFASHWEGRSEILTFPLAKRYTFWVAARLFVNLDEPSEIIKLEGPFNGLASGILSIPIDLPGTPLNRAKKAARYIRKELLKLIKQRKIDLVEGNASPTQDILSHMLTGTDDGFCMTELDIADKIVALLIAGHDTTSATCTFIVKYLAELPHIYEGVYKEQMEIAKSKAEGEWLTWDDLKKMKYSWNVACEVLRLQPPLQGTFREALSEFIYNGFTIPKGWKLYWTVNSTHKDAVHFPEPEKFIPTRFEGKGPAPYTYVPFGGGPRMCPGKEYARMELLVFIHNLVKRFKWEKKISQESIIVDPMPIPVKGLPIRLFPHPPTATAASV